MPPAARNRIAWTHHAAPRIRSRAVRGYQILSVVEQRVGRSHTPRDRCLSTLYLLPRPPKTVRPMEGQCLTQPDLDSSSTGLRGAEKRLNSRVRAKACEGSQSHALGDDSAAAAGHTRQTKARTHGGSPSGDRLPAAGDVGEDARVRRTSKREGAPGGAASASPGGASSRELRRGTSSPAASRSSAAPGPTPAPKPSAHSAEASAPLSAASQHAQSASLAATERLLRAGLAALGGSSLPGGASKRPATAARTQASRLRSRRRSNRR